MASRRRRAGRRLTRGGGSAKGGGFGYDMECSLGPFCQLPSKQARDTGQRRGPDGHARAGREEAQALAAHFVDNMPKLSSEGYRLFPEGARERLLDRYRELNQRLFTTRLSAYDPTYYENS